MQRIQLTDDQRRQLALGLGQVELTDPKGNVLGQYRLVVDYAELAGNPAWPSKEELDRIENEEQNYSSEQVLAMLRGETP